MVRPDPAPKSRARCAGSTQR